MFDLKHMFAKANLVELLTALVTRRKEIADTIDDSDDSPKTVYLDRERKLCGDVIESLHKFYGSNYLSEIIADIEIGISEYKLPPVKPDLHEFEKLAQPSVDVLARVNGFKNPMMGRYIYGIGEWQVDGVHGSVTVSEWWPIPAAGTGHKV